MIMVETRQCIDPMSRTYCLVFWLIDRSKEISQKARYPALEGTSGGSESGWGWASTPFAVLGYLLTSLVDGYIIEALVNSVRPLEG